jgi:GNAT superfamily N-acetyltransferase
MSRFEDEVVPDDVKELVTREYRLTRYPKRLVSPTFPAVQVSHLDFTRSFDVVYEEVRQIVRSWGDDAMHWWVSATLTAPMVERRLIDKGATVSDDAKVLARAVDAPDAAIRLPADITLEEARDASAFRAASSVQTSGWGRAPLSEIELRSYVAAMIAERTSSDRFCVIAYVDNAPAAVGWCSVRGDAARLWGAVTLSEFRGRGCYRGVLATRMRIARERGATMAVTRGRSSTSAPILVGAGFTVHDEERCYRTRVN